MAAVSVKSVAASVPFHDFCSLLERVSASRGTDKKKKLICTFLEQWRSAHRALHCSDTASASDSFFPAMRLLVPHVDKDRLPYGMKEVVLAKYYIEILGIGKESADAQKLLHYRAPKTPKQDSGDFASVAYFVLKTRCPEKGSLNLLEVNRYLDDVAVANTKRERGDMKTSLQILLRNTSALEQKWLIRMIMRDMKMGLSETSILSVFHPDAVDLFSVCSSLERVCVDLHSLDTHLNEAAIVLCTPFRPMLGQRAAVDQVPKLMEHSWFYIETKFDGDRMQMHKNGNQYHFFSRSSKDYTPSFGASSMEGPFTPNIHGAFDSKVQRCILDGEMVGWDAETESYVPKGDHLDVKAVGESSSSVQQCFVAFDVLLVDGQNLANKPQQERADILSTLFTPVPGYLHLVERRRGSTKEDVVSALNEAIDRREEGLVIKSPSSMYKPDKRKGSGWLKIKPEYVDSLSDQLDLLIIGGYYGKGRRAGMISHFLCGVALAPDNSRDKPSVFYTFCKVGSGYSMMELKEVGRQLSEHWRPFDPMAPPPCIAMATSSYREKPDVWLEPSKSKIVQIRAAEIVTSARYKCGYTLRFPRLEKFRDDKHWFDCMTVEELDQLYSVASGHLAHQHYEEGEEGEAPSSKRRKAAVRVERPRGVAPHFRPADTTDVQEVSKMLSGKELCVINGTPSLSKEEIERRIVQHGGSFVQNPGSGTMSVLVAKVTQRVKNIIRMGLYDVVKTEWFEQCLREGRCIPLVPAHMVHTSPQTAESFSQLFDCHGDSYREPATEESLRTVFGMITEMGTPVSISQEEIALVESKYFTNDSPLGLFRQYRFYVDRYREVGNPRTAISACPLDLTLLEIRYHGGTVSETLEETVSHVVVDESDLSRLAVLRSLERGHTKKHHFVTSVWVEACLRGGALLCERSYEPQVVQQPTT